MIMIEFVRRSLNPLAKRSLSNNNSDAQELNIPNT